MNEFYKLVEIMKKLRAPNGCPWDREQTIESLKPYLLEETYETLEAMDIGGEELKGELGVVDELLLTDDFSGKRISLGFSLEFARFKVPPLNTNSSAN